MGPTEDLFEGEPGGLPAPMPRGSARYREPADPTAAVRHVRGYAPFVAFCEGRGVRAGDLASDPERLIRFLRTSAARIGGDSTLSAAAAIFFGNTIARLIPDAQWSAYEGASPTVGTRARGIEVDRLLEGLRTADDHAVEGLVSMLADWAREAPAEAMEDAPAMRSRPVPPAADPFL
ncbi:hypothetical protein [Pseudarthrobacter sp. 1C304]|uniref:hypothetical protein n=1 Tax=Pseudarthrobacter sp. 1C304 TaxID=3457438 RepID=UPI003FD5960A